MKVDILIDDVQIREELKTELEKIWNEMLFTWDIEEMSKRTCLSKSSLERMFLKDIRMALHMRRHSKGKRIWFYKESIETMKEIMDEW